jgi:hypothetical protein
MKHTPGPWVLYQPADAKPYIGTAHKGISHQVIADLAPCQEQIPNGQLLAAATEMFALLEDILVEYDQDKDIFLPAIDAVRTLVAKVKGEV